MTSGEEDFTKRMKGKFDLWWIKNVLLKDPTIAGCIPISVEHIVDINHKQILGVALKTPSFSQCVPCSIENNAIAYNATMDRFKVDIEAMTVGTIGVDVSDEWTRQLGQIDLARVLGVALSHSNPVISRLTDGSAFIDPRDVADRAARLVGIVYGSLDKLQQQATTKELLVQISHQGVIKDPTQIRTLTSSDAVKAYGSQTQALLQRATTYDLIVQLRHNGAEIDPTQIRALTSSDQITADQSTRTSLKVQPEREDLTSLRGTSTPNNAGVQIIAPDGSKKIKIYDAGYECAVDGLHYFYFGTSTTATTRAFLTRKTKGAILKTFVQPRVSNAGDGLYVYSAVNETSFDWDVGYVQE